MIEKLSFIQYTLVIDNVIIFTSNLIARMK